MALHPEVAAYRAARAAAGTPPLYAQTLAEARAADLAAIRAGGGAVEPVTEVRDERIPGPAGELPLRVYRPAGSGPLPTLLYFFGGGWTLGSIDTADGICRRLANAVPCQVITVGYRLAPEHPFPAAVHDCHAAPAGSPGTPTGWAWTRLGWRWEGTAPAGTWPPRSPCSAGRTGPRSPRNCWSIRTPTRAASRPATTTRRCSTAVRSPGTGRTTWPTRPTPGIRWPPAARRRPVRVAAGAGDHRRTGPPHAEGQRYAERLRDAGVSTRLEHYPGMIHGFFAMPGTFTDGRRAQGSAAAFLRERFGLRRRAADPAADAGGPGPGDG